MTAMAAISAFFLSSCVQSYDRSGRPIQTVDPGAAIVGGVAIAAITYAIADNNGGGRRGRGFRRSRY